VAADVRVMLIGGSSHCGKSTVAARIAGRLGWEAVSTDTMGRHPGRPWPPQLLDARPHVAEHYGTLSVDELMASVLEHYEQRIWPVAQALIGERAAADGPALVLEGSAVWPPFATALGLASVSAVWLTAHPQLFEARIRGESDYAAADARGRRLIDSFLARTIAFDAAMREQAERLGLPVLQVRDDDTVDDVAERCLAQMRPLG
jgi:2-phosphoglycerate kinase